MTIVSWHGRVDIVPGDAGFFRRVDVNVAVIARRPHIRNSQNHDVVVALEVERNDLIDVVHARVVYLVDGLDQPVGGIAHDQILIGAGNGTSGKSKNQH